MYGFYQRAKILHRAEQGIDASVIRDVVTEIGHWRGKDRRQPDRVDAKRLQIRQPLDDPLEVADAVTIGILKGSRIDLIKNAVPPPGFDARRHVQLVFWFV